MNDQATETIGEMLASQHRTTIVRALLAAVAAVYVGGIMVASVFNFSLMTGALSGALRMFASVGVLLVSISALLYPIAYHYWTAPGVHRTMCVVFYAVDLAILSANAIGEYNRLSVGAVPVWLTGWIQFAPATLLFPPIAWAVLWHLDPRNQVEDAEAELRAAALQNLRARMMAYTKSDALNQDVQAGAQLMAQNVVRQVVAESSSRRVRGQPAYAAEPPGGNGRLKVTELPNPKN